MTRLTVLERVALVIFALFVGGVGQQVLDGDGWWRVLVGVPLGLVALGIAVAAIAVGRGGAGDGP